MNVNIFAVRDNIDAFHTIRSLEKKNIKAKVRNFFTYHCIWGKGD